MATVQPPLRPLSAPPRRRGRRIAFWLALAAACAAAWFWKPLNGSATAAAAYGARIGCSCRYVAGREIGQCKGDLEAGMRWVTLSADDEAKSVTARVPLLASQTATWREGQGCMLEKWED